MTTSRSVRVFLSSTFRDFAEERDLLVRKVFPELRRRARERNVEVIDIDLRWGITPEQAERGEVLPICLAEIDRARPYFFGFIGDRYGWVPEANQYDLSLLVEQPWLEEHRGGKSVTELEMLHGVLNNPAMAGRAFFYFRDTQYSQAKGGAYLSEGEEHRAKLELLKGRIRESGFPVMEDYPSPEVLAWRVEEDLWRVIDEAFPAESVPDAVTMERRKHEVYGAARLGLYLGGEKYFAALNAAMEAEPFKPVLITGPSGGGKSALVANWVERYAAAHPDAWVITHYLGSSADAADPVRMVYRIEREIAQATGEHDKLEGDPNKILQHFPEWLSCASAFAEEAGREWIIVLDGLDKLSSRTELRWWPSKIPPRIKLVASCLDGEIQSALQSRMKPCEVVVHPLNAQDGCELIRTYLARFNKVLPEPDVERIVAHPLGGSPLFLRTVAEEMRVFGVHEQLQQRLGGYLESGSMGELFAKLFDRIEEDNRHEDMEAALSVLWGALESFAEDELIAVTGLAPAVWSSILNALEGSLICNGGRIGFGHDYLRKAVEDRYVGDSEKQSAVMRKLSDFCGERMRSEGRKANSSYVRRQAVRHFIIAEQWDEAVAALSDLEFIEARARELSEMLADYAGVIRSLPEGQKERETEASRQAELDRYARESAEYVAARGRIGGGSMEPAPARPRPIKSVRLWTQREIGTERRRMTKRPNRLDVVKAFRVFVAAHVAPIQANATQEYFIANLARNDALAGPVYDEGTRRLALVECTKLIRRFATNEMYNPLRACEAVLEGHDDAVESVCLSGDESMIVSGSRDGTVRVWDSETGDCRKVMDEHFGTVHSVVISRDGGFVVSGSIDCTVRIWDAETGDCLRVLEGHEDCVKSVCVSDDGRRIVSGSWDRSLRIWNTETGDCIKVLDGHKDRVFDVSLSIDGKKIESKSEDKTIRIWDADTGECLDILDITREIRWDPMVKLRGKNEVQSADGKIKVRVGADEKIRIWKECFTKPKRTLEGHLDNVLSVAISADGRRIVSGSEDKTIRVWNAESGECLLDYSKKHEMHVTSLALSADAKRSVSGSVDGTIRLWDVEKAECLGSRVVHEDVLAVDSVALSADGRRIAAVCGSEVWILDSNSAACLRVLQGHKKRLEIATFNRDGSRIVSGSWDSTIRIWNTETGDCIKVLEGHQKVVTAVCVNDDGSRIVSGSLDNTLRIWDTKTGDCIKVLEGHKSGVNSVCLCDDGSRIASGGGDGAVRIWESETGGCLNVMDAHDCYIHTILLSAGGSTIISGSREGFLRIWDSQTGYCKRVFFLRGLCCLATDPKFQKIVAGFSDGRVEFYDIKNLPLSPFITNGFRNSTARPICCAQIVDVPAAVTERIDHWSTHPGEDGYADPSLLMPCPHCQTPLRMNPFFVAPPLL